MSENKWDITRLDGGGRSALKRNAGIMMGNNLQAMEAFYRAAVVIPKRQEQEAQWYACLCMECLWKPENHPKVVRFEELLRKMYQSGDVSDSIKHRIITVLDVPWGGDGFLLGKLSNLAKLLLGKDSGTMPDFNTLADDLANWNHPDRFVERRWIRTICGSPKEIPETINNTEEENENAD